MLAQKAFYPQSQPQISPDPNMTSHLHIFLVGTGVLQGFRKRGKQPSSGQESGFKPRRSKELNMPAQGSSLLSLLHPSSLPPSPSSSFSSFPSPSLHSRVATSYGEHWKKRANLTGCQSLGLGDLFCSHSLLYFTMIQIFYPMYGVRYSYAPEQEMHVSRN